MLPFRLLLLLCAASIPSLLSAQSTSPCNWNPDYNGDNAIGISDLLALLSVFEEVDNDDDGIFDSHDDCVGIIDPCGVCNGTGVDADADGICDDADPCVGMLDACGLCNGPGPTFPIIDEIIYATDSVYLPPVGSWYVFTYAVDTLYTYVCPVQGCMDPAATNFNPSAVIEDGSCMYGPAQCGGQSTITFDGYTYALVGIGTQCWFKENLRSDNYRNGDPIPGELSDGQWNSTMVGAQSVYNNDVANLATYGRLYNWYATQDSRGLCPTGFHVPSDGEWMTLEMTLGMTQAQGDGWGWRGTDQGAQMKASPSDTPSWNGANTSGFSGLPAGERGSSGFLYYLGSNGNWWSSSLHGGNAIFRSLVTGYSNVYRFNFSQHYGFSVRCVQDAESTACFDPDADSVCAENEVGGCTDSTASNFNPEATEEDESCEYPGPAQCGGQSTVNFDGHTYALVGIGTQCWFKENLKSDNYRNGDPIPGELSDSQWSSTTSGAQTVYGEGTSVVYAGSSDEVVNLGAYGRLYNWYAVNDVRGLCPMGFHIPSDVEWTSLTNSLGGSSLAGAALKSQAPAWDGNNSSGFSALPGGYRNASSGYFDVMIVDGYWWSATPNGVYSWGRAMHSGLSSVNRYNTHPKRDGFSVRCVKD
jgi:uncharacterized protein (TIGR02145 family)